jgi:hypothetical protein
MSENPQKTEKSSGLLDYAQNIVESLSTHGLSAEFFTEAAFPLEKLSCVLDISAEQAALFSYLLECSGGEPTEISEISEGLKCGNIQLLKYLDDFEALERKKLVRAVSMSRNDYPFNNARKNSLPSYRIPLDVVKALRQGIAYKGPSYDNLSVADFYNTVAELFASLRDSEITLDALFYELKSLYKANRDIQFVHELSSMELDDEEAFVLMIFCWSRVERHLEIFRMSEFRSFVGYAAARRIRNKLKNREHKLIVLGLIENDNDDGIADTELYRLSDKAVKTLLGDVQLKKENKKDRKDFIYAERIKKKELFYSPKIKSSIEELTDLLRKENFRAVKRRLAERKMRTGFTCLFSGPPGTGKTETVYQIARTTGRDIFVVDISATKSMWFGESEKKIKNLFDQYHAMAKQKRNAPILLFNEADGVLGKRQELGDTRRGPAQTENAIQNIILQEMETFSDGILIATTNMKDNFDKAFERRFLYKIEFEQPGEETKAAIWQSILPHLSYEHVLTLSRNFDLSGGQIDNIARKEAVSSLLKGGSLSLEDIFILCEAEVSGKKAARIGFAL